MLTAAGTLGSDAVNALSGLPRLVSHYDLKRESCWQVPVERVPLEETLAWRLSIVLAHAAVTSGA